MGIKEDWHGWGKSFDQGLHDECDPKGLEGFMRWVQHSSDFSVVIKPRGIKGADAKLLCKSSGKSWDVEVEYAKTRWLNDGLEFPRNRRTHEYYPDLHVLHRRDKYVGQSDVIYIQISADLKGLLTLPDVGRRISEVKPRLMRNTYSEGKLEPFYPVENKYFRLWSIDTGKHLVGECQCNICEENKDVG